MDLASPRQNSEGKKSSYKSDTILHFFLSELRLKHFVVFLAYMVEKLDL